MTPSMWLTLVAAVGMTILVVTVVHARHPLAAPLGALIVDMLVWNLAWLAFQLSGDDRWRWLAQCAASLVAVLGLDFVLTFVGRRRELSWVRRLAYGFFALTTVSSASRFVAPHSVLYASDELWWRAVAGGGAATSVLVGWLLITHLQGQHDRAERAHTRLLMLGFALWTVLAATDLLHRRLALVPQMSAVGMLLCVAVMTVVMDRLRTDGPSRWWALYVVALYVVALCGNFVVFQTLPAPTAMILMRAVIFVAVGVAVAREVVVMMVRRQRRLAELALVGRVTAQMAHDLHNPLAAIQCAVEVIEEDRLRGHLEDGRRRRMLAVIAQQTARLSAIVEDYRRVGRIEPRARAVALADVLARIGCPPEVRLSVDVAAAPPCAVDPELMARALDNLVRNAAEAMPHGGVVTVSACASDDHARSVELCVHDEGSGMDARTAERAFDDFFTTKARGSGLGLAFVRRVVEAHGGDVRIVSRLGHGTSVIARLPAAVAAVPCLTERLHVAA